MWLGLQLDPVPELYISMGGFGQAPVPGYPVMESFGGPLPASTLAEAHWKISKLDGPLTGTVTIAILLNGNDIGWAVTLTPEKPAGYFKGSFPWPSGGMFVLYVTQEGTPAGLLLNGSIGMGVGNRRTAARGL